MLNESSHVISFYRVRIQMLPHTLNFRVKFILLAAAAVCIR
jgi:hypothetical protein